MQPWNKSTRTLKMSTATLSTGTMQNEIDRLQAELTVQYRQNAVLVSTVQCGICHDVMACPHALTACGHAFCAECLFAFLDSSRIRRGSAQRA